MTSIYSPSSGETDLTKLNMALQEHARQFDNYLTTATASTTYAPIASPTFTGTPKAPTATAGTNTTQIATTAFVATSFAPLASPAFTGNPTAPTPANGDADTSIATTAFCANASNLTSGTVGTARLGSGSASSSTYLRGDSTWATPGLVNLGSTATTSGTSVSVTGIPSTAQRIIIILSGISWAASARAMIQVGTSGGLVTGSSKYSGVSGYTFSASASNLTSVTTGWEVGAATLPANTMNGVVTLVTSGSNNWFCTAQTSNVTDNWAGNICGIITSANLGGTLDRVAITSTTAQTFDAGSITVLYE